MSLLPTTSQRMPRIVFSYFDSEKDRYPARVEASTFQQIAADLASPTVREGKSGPALSPARYEDGTTRKNDHVRGCAFLAFDFDSLNEDSFEQLLSSLRDTSAVVYTTFSSEKFEGVIKARALIEVSREMTPEEYRKLILFVGNSLGVEYDQLTDPARIFFLPSCPSERCDRFRYRCIEGSALDVDAALAEAGGTASAEAARVSLANLSVEKKRRDLICRAYALLQLRKSAHALATTRYPMPGYYNVLRRHAYTIGGYVPLDLDFEEVMDVLMEAIHQRSPNPEHAESKREQVEQAVAAGREKPLMIRENPFPHDDTALGDILVAQEGRDVRFVRESGRWCLWNGVSWDVHTDIRLVLGKARSVRKTVLDRAHRLFREANMEQDEHIAKLLRRKAKEHVTLAKRAASASGRRAMAEIALSTQCMQVATDSLNANPFLFGAGNGYLDLRTGELEEPRRIDYVTQRSSVCFDPRARCDRWEQFVLEVACGDEELATFLKRMAGYLLTGLVQERKLFFLIGDGCNGKTTFLRVLQHVAGEYGYTAPNTLIQRCRSDQHPADKASLFGRRIAICGELDDARGWDESKIKELTGGDVISARAMRENFWNFKPTHKFLVASNHKPHVRGTDDGIWSRLCVINFKASFLGREDRNLFEDLMAEDSGILRWCAEGAREYFDNGLQVASSIEEAIQGYREDQDVLGQFIEEMLVRDGREHKLGRSQIKRTFEEWCAATDDARYMPTAKILYRRLKDEGFPPCKINGVRGFSHVRIRGAGEEDSVSHWRGSWGRRRSFYS